MAGWIKVFRKLQDWEWYSDSQMVHLFIHLLLESNHESRKWRGIDIHPGQLIFGRKVVAETLGISEQSLRTCMSRLKSTNEITIKSTNRFSLVTIVKWEEYQGEDKKSTSKSTNKLTFNQPTTNQQSTTPKEYKEDTTNVVSIHPLCVWISKTLPNVSKLKTQLTDQEAENLVKKFDKAIIREILEAMENKSDLTKKYRSVNLTIQNWIKLRKAKNPEAKVESKKVDYSQQADFYAAYENMKAV